MTEQPAKPGSIPLDLSWEAPESCPAAGDVLERVRAHLGRERIVPDPRVRLRVNAHVTRHDDQHDLALDIISPAGSTKVSALDPACEVLAELVAIKVSLALDPVETARGLLTAPEPEPEPTQQPQPRPAPRSTPAPEPPAPGPRPRLLLQVAPSIGGGLLPSVEAGGFLALGVTGRLWSVAFGATAVGGPDLDVAEPLGGRVRLLAAFAEATGCALPAARRVIFPACVELLGGAIVARGRGLAVNRSAASPVLAAGVATGITWPADGRVRLLLRARARVNAMRPSFGVGGVGEVHRAGIVSGQAVVGMELALGR